MAERLFPPLMIHGNFSSGSITVGWAIDIDLVPTLANKIYELDSSSFFETHLVVSLSLKGNQVYFLSIHRASEKDKPAICTGIIRYNIS